VAFSAEWLALRDPADRAARDARLDDTAARAGGPAPVILDLGAGTGATARALGPRLPAGTAWRLVDHDAGLLAHATAAVPGSVAVTADLAAPDALAALPWDGVTLVTCSALIDLVSADWLDRLATLLAARRLPFHAALAYDGQMEWDPADPADAAVTAAFNRHQRGDKGFGPALGPAAAGHLRAALAARGFRVATAPSPWRLGPADAALRAALVDGIAAAAAEAGEAAAPGWAARRGAAAGAGTMTVGHSDLLALPRI
jgi:SAM-dependent methyltransferase